MSGNDKDIYLQNLRLDEKKKEGESSKPKKKNRKNNPRKPKRGAGRISARRIGGQNLHLDFEAYRAAKMPPNGAVSAMGKLHSVPVDSAPSEDKRKNRKSQKMGGTLPRVEELGGSMMSLPARRSSSRLGPKGRPRSRRLSSASNHSGTHTEGTQQNKEIIIRYGELEKKGVVTNTWKSRFFVLSDRHLFYFLEPFDVPQEINQIEATPKGQIDLQGVEEVRKDKGDASGASFQVFTPTRTYRVRMPASESEHNLAKYGADAWVAALRGACENAKQQAHSVQAKASRASFSYKVDELDTTPVFQNPGKRITKSADILGPHKPASLDEVEQWTPFDVAAWLYTVHLQKYSEDFYQNAVDGKVLKSLPEKEVGELKELGVEEGDVQELVQAIDTLKAMNQLADEPL